MIRSIFSLALVLVFTSTALAIGPEVGFGVHANFTSSNFPGPSVGGGTSQLSNAYGVGWGGGLHMDVDLMVISFRLSGDYIHYGIDENKFRDGFRPLFGNAVSQMSINGGGLGIYAATVNGKMPVLPLPIISPYLTGGLGLAWLSRDQMTTSISGVQGTTIPSNTQSARTTVDLGLGVDVKIGIDLFLEVKYAWIFTEGGTSTYVPVCVGVTF